MSLTAAEILNEHSTNPCSETFNHSASSKEWTKSYPPISRARIHTIEQGSRCVQANFDAFHGEYDDDRLRLTEPIYPPNFREYRLNSEEDGVNWFHTEVSNIVLATFTNYPTLLQASHEKPFSETRYDQTVDTAYSVRSGSGRKHVAIGEFKRGLITRREWQNGKLGHSQQGLSRELRAYAHIYACPQIFCFDNYTFLMLQFRARTPDQIKDSKCPVDAWVLPRNNTRGCTLRYALYRLLVQGFRRCQGQASLDVTLHGQRAFERDFYNGTQLWKADDGRLYYMPWGYHRVVSNTNGAFYWALPGSSDPVVDTNGDVLWDSTSFWMREEAQQSEQGEQEDIYSAD